MQTIRTAIKFMAIMLSIVAAAFAMTSCSEEYNDPLDVKSVNVEYLLELSQTWYEFYVIDVTYYASRQKEYP